MQIEVNGEQREVADQIALADLIKELALAPERVAIELNKKVVRRLDWAAITIAEGDRIEIVHFVGGGYQSADGRSRRQGSGSAGGPLATNAKRESTAGN